MAPAALGASSSYNPPITDGNGSTERCRPDPGTGTGIDAGPGTGIRTATVPAKPARPVAKRRRHTGGGMRSHLHWWRKLRLPRRGRKATMLTPATLTLGQTAVLTERRTELRDAILAPRATRLHFLARAVWQPPCDPSADGDRGGGGDGGGDGGSSGCEANCGEVSVIVTQKGRTLQSMGEWRAGKQWLYPEEVLFMVDKGSLELLRNDLAVSVQHCWTLALNAPSAPSLHAYLVFAHLRRAGYVVRRYNDRRRLASPVSPGDGEKGVAAGGGGAERLDESARAANDFEPDFTVWRAGAFSRRGDGDDVQRRAAFVVKAFDLDEAPATIQAFVDWSSSVSPPSLPLGGGTDAPLTGGSRGGGKRRGGKGGGGGAAEGAGAATPRCRIALVDRGTVLFVDVASRATPLSQRFIRRLPLQEAETADRLAKGDAAAIFPGDVLAQWKAEA